MHIFGTHDPATIAQLTDVASHATRVALMADGHVGYTMLVGGVAAYREQVSVVGVGFDIACGNAAIRTNMTLDQIEKPTPSPTRSARRSASASAGRIAPTTRLPMHRSSRTKRGRADEFDPYKD